MNRLEKLKKEHIKKVNELLDEGFKNQDPKERPIILIIFILATSYRGNIFII